MTEFYQHFRAPSVTVNTYSTNFRRQLSKLKYNGVSISSAAAAKQYIIGLGSEFIPIQNQSTLPPEFCTNTLIQLEKAARDHLKRVLANRALQKHQQSITQDNTQQQ